MLTWHEVRRRLWLALLFGGAAATIGVVLQNLDRLRGIAPERVVTIYRIHGCQCAVTWAAALEQRGDVVRIWEYETLEHVSDDAASAREIVRVLKPGGRAAISAA